MIPKGFEKLVGEWRGSNRLHTTWIPEDPIKDSESHCSVKLAAMGQALKLEYTWNYQGAPQAGLMIICSPKDSEKVDFYWLDSWHLSNSFMNSEGKIDRNVISVKGYYKVPDHPDWGWRTDFDCGDGASFSFTMYNVTPEGEESLAVESAFTRS